MSTDVTPRKIVIVEDDPIVGHDIRFRLLRLGYDVVGLEKVAASAMEKIHETSPDLVLLDIRLGTSDEDGISVARRIRAHRDIPVVFTTAYADERTVARARLTEPAAYLLKPLETRELQIAIELALERHRQAQAAEEGRRRLLALLQNMGDALIAADSSGRVQYMNSAAERLTAWRSGKGRGQPMSRVFRVDLPEGAEDPVQPTSEESPEARVGDAVLISKEGKLRVIEYVAAPLHLGKPGKPGTVVVFQDEAERAKFWR